ncbi:hypothetical protein B5E80_17955 [Flavonifractor sp. An135]|nr:hypothetical protein [Flavonifractor sp. An135]OUQ18613.1 hypothetical protein B5E80_17955 [Flavonifractor sp. An135]
MSCKYKDECPSYSGWCEGPKQEFERCIPFLISAVENARAELDKIRASPEVLYECDRRACQKCNPQCRFTKDIRHAANFQMTGAGVMIEGGEDYGI